MNSPRAGPREGLRTAARRLAGGRLFGPPSPSLVSNALLGCILVFGQCLALAVWGILDGTILVVLAAMLLVGTSLIAKSAGDLAFGRFRSLSVFLRAFAWLNSVSAFVLLVIWAGRQLA